MKPQKPGPRASEYTIQNKIIFIFIKICNQFKNLRYLNFSSSSIYKQLAFYEHTSINFSSNLLELHVVVKTIHDCLCLLNGQFQQLHTFYVTVRSSGVCGRKIVDNDVSYLYINLFFNE